MTRHERAVVNRLMEYDFTLLTGYSFLDECALCERNYVIDCKECLLRNMDSADNCYPCCTDKRTNARVGRLSWIEDKLGKRWLNDIRARYDELNDYLVKEGY